MTIRSEINKKKHKITFVIFLGFAIFILGTAVNISYKGIPIIVLCGFAISFFGMLYSYFGIACPKCKKLWGYMAMYPSPFNISKRIRFCPFCGEDIDKEFRSHTL
jgi:hypothetical protein